MKKLSAVALIFSLSITFGPQYAMGQSSSSSRKFSGGIMVNPSVNWLSANVDDPTKNKVESPGASFGFSYGLLGEFFFNNNYGISTNLRVSGFDAQMNYTPKLNSDPVIERKLHLQYMELPISLKMRTNEVGYMKYFAQFGIMPSVLLGAKGDIDTLKGGVKTSLPPGLNVTKSMNILNLYSVIGLGAEYNLGGSTSIVVSITWNNGFTNLWHKGSGDDTSVNPPLYRNFNSPPENISLNAGVLF